MNPTKSDTIRLRIHPDKKAALDAVAKNQQLDTSKLLMAQIEKLLAQESLKENPEGVGQGEAAKPLVSPDFIPATAGRRTASQPLRRRAGHKTQ